MDNFDYKKHSLKQVETWVRDALVSAEVSPQEIYDTIRGVVNEEYHYFKHHTGRCYDLLALLNGNGRGYLTCDKDDKSSECQEAWNSFWEENYYPEEIEEIRKEGGYEWTPEPEVKTDRVTKWILPVEECKDADIDKIEYFISFPDDLLEAANLKEGDQIEWIDNCDGSYLLRKVTRPLRMDEC